VIVEWLLGLILAFFEFVLGLLPSFTPPSFGGVFEETCALDAIPLSGPGCQAANIFSDVGYLDSWLDISTLVLVVAAALAVWAGVSAAKLVLWLYDRFPFKSA